MLRSFGSLACFYVYLSELTIGNSDQLEADKIRGRIMLDSQTMTPVSETAFFCCGIRELDADSRYPICNDVYAKNFMTEEGREAYKKYSPGYFAKGLNYVRPKIIDNLVASRIKENPGLQIILIGAGFDSRAYRLAGGNWLEIDEAAIINHKNKHLPIEQCPNALERVAINFAEDNLTDLLDEYTSHHECLFIVEGVFMYLEIREIESLLAAIKHAKVKHTLICDLMTHSFINIFGKNSKKSFDNSGAEIKCQTDTPELIFAEHDYILRDEISIVDSAIQYGSIKFPKFLAFKKLRRGFRVMFFELG